MPYRNKKIDYGLLNESYDAERIAELLAVLKDTIGLNRSLVGVKLFFTKADYDACDLPEPAAKISYCLMVKAATNGRGCKSKLEHHNCDGGTTALALEKASSEIENGEVYYSYHLYASKVSARRHYMSIRSLNNYLPLTYGIMTVPLENSKIEPDIIIGIINPYQAMRIVQGYEYYTGVKPNLDLGAMQGLCSEITVSPYLSGELNLSVLCPGTRLLCKWKEEDMAVGIPFERFEEIVSGVAYSKPNYESKRHEVSE
jgi:uncharacterized protein (DUF169 family)